MSGIVEYQAVRILPSVRHACALAGFSENPIKLRRDVAATTTNSLNQYSQREVPGAIDIMGTANVGATVTVNDQATARKADYFYKESFQRILEGASFRYSNTYDVISRSNTDWESRRHVAQGARNSDGLKRRALTSVLAWIVRRGFCLLHSMR